MFHHENKIGINSIISKKYGSKCPVIVRYNFSNINEEVNNKNLKCKEIIEFNKKNLFWKRKILKNNKGPLSKHMIPVDLDNFKITQKNNSKHFNPKFKLKTKYLKKNLFKLKKEKEELDLKIEDLEKKCNTNYIDNPNNSTNPFAFILDEINSFNKNIGSSSKENSKNKDIKIQNVHKFNRVQSAKVVRPQTSKIDLNAIYQIEELENESYYNEDEEEILLKNNIENNTNTNNKTNTLKINNNINIDFDKQETTNLRKNSVYQNTILNDNIQGNSLKKTISYYNCYNNKKNKDIKLYNNLLLRSNQEELSVKGSNINFSSKAKPNLKKIEIYNKKNLTVKTRLKRPQTAINLNN